MDAEKIKDLMTQAYNHLSVAAVAGDAAEHVGDARIYNGGWRKASPMVFNG